MMSSASSINPLMAYDTDLTIHTGFNIQINWDSSVASAPAAFVTDVEQVANYFASELQSSTPITINIDVGYGEINGTHISGSALGESETNLQQVNYSTLITDYQNAGLSLPISHPKGNFYVSDAEAQAFGIITNTPTVDGYIGFSSQSGIFDYNNSDGVSAKQYDFEGTVAHEISEVLGREFLSGHSYSAYALFHYSSNGVQDFAASGGYFSLDGGKTNLGNFNTAHGGDGADWAAGGTSNTLGGSAYDAFNAFGTTGQIAPVTPTDLLTLKALGFQLSPAAVAETTQLDPPPKSNSTNADTFVFPPNLGQHNNVETVTDQIQPPHSDMSPHSELLTAVSVDVHHNGQDIGVAHDASGFDQVSASHLHAVQNVHLV